MQINESLDSFLFLLIYVKEESKGIGFPILRSMIENWLTKSLIPNRKHLTCDSCLQLCFMIFFAAIERRLHNRDCNAPSEKWSSNKRSIRSGERTKRADRERPRPRPPTTTDTITLRTNAAAYNTEQ